MIEYWINNETFIWQNFSEKYSLYNIQLKYMIQNCSCNLAPTLNFEDKEKWIIRLEKKNCLHMFIVIITQTYKWLLFSFFMFFTSFQISYNKQI